METVHLLTYACSRWLMQQAQLTELLQKVLINFMKEQFADRLVTIKPNFSVLNMSGKEGTVPFTDVHVAI